jgi:hypothetical protein
MTATELYYFGIWELWIKFKDSLIRSSVTTSFFLAAHNLCELLSIDPGFAQ